MSRFLTSVICAVLLSGFANAAPAPAASSVASSAASSVASIIDGDGASTASAASATPTLAYASDYANGLMWNPASTTDTEEDLQPIRGTLGASILGPQNLALQQQNPDLLAPPTTDHGTV